jgi:uncharacterized protein YdhG (YjbR/CyaY superfamily)
MKRAKAATIDAYIAGYPADVQARLEAIRATIRRAAPQARERISYAIPTFSQCGNVVHFAAYEHHIGFYPGASAVKRFAKDLARYASAKGSVQFPLDRPVPLGLIGRITRFRVAENVAKYAAPSAKRQTRVKKKTNKEATTGNKRRS